MKEMFEKTADEIFAAAGYPKEKAPTLYEDVVSILSSKMAALSATMGMSYKRLEAYEEQKQALIGDLKKFKEEGFHR